MNAKVLSQTGEPAKAGDDFSAEGLPFPSSRACCCPAKPVVRVAMPPTATRHHAVDLLLCGHHYRVSCQALAKANATVTELTEITGHTLPALLPDLPRQRTA